MNRRAMILDFRAATTFALPLALLACHAGPTSNEQTGHEQTVRQPDAPLAGAAIGGPFTLVDKTGRTVKWADFAGKYRIVYFGYTFCPDACPLDVNTMMQGYARFAQAHPALAAKVQPMFITIDPARDTPKIVGEFASAFSPRLLGLTGSQEQVDQAAKAFRVYYAKGKETDGGYLMDHSRIAYLMGTHGAPIAMLPVDKGADAVAEELAKWIS